MGVWVFFNIAKTGEKKEQLEPYLFDKKKGQTGLGGGDTGFSSFTQCIIGAMSSTGAALV